jgi:pimeloyl-ACP methyl ester carboxylesterase
VRVVEHRAYGEPAGHMAFVEAPEEYVQVVGDFLTRATR